MKMIQTLPQKMNDIIDDDSEKSKESEQEEIDCGDVEMTGVDPFEEQSDLRRSERLQQRAQLLNDDEGDQFFYSSRYRPQTPPPESERVEPWHFANVEAVQQWREFCRNELFRDTHQMGVGGSFWQNRSASKRGPYKSTTVELDQMLKS